MKKKTFIYNSYFWAIIWAIFCFVSWYNNLGLGTTATLGGIALMFAWMAEQIRIQD
ncbi:hypothetical protein J4463_01725 [Candidatus Pacearchaeota archaeon]|nr:hypothetical protein [Candidatus Pacearchaeota archaeon]